MTIAEELLLLAYRESTGKPMIGHHELDPAVAGALLSELVVNERVELSDKRVVVRDASPLGDQELDGALARIAQEAKPRKPDHWVNKLQSGKLRERLLTRLAERGVLTAEHGKALGIFPTTRWPEADPGVELEVRERVDSALAGGTPEARTAVLIALTRAVKLDRKAFPGADRKRIKEISEGAWAADAVAKTVQAVNAAIMTAITVSAVAASTSAGSGS